MSGVEFRSGPNGELWLTGYATVFDVPYSVGGLFTETMLRGCARRSISNNVDCCLLIEHEGLPLARTRSPSGGEATLKLSEDQKGLWCEGQLDIRNPRVQELRSVSEHTGLAMSMGMEVNADTWSKDLTDRKVKDATFRDVTATCMPANPATSMSIDARTSEYKTTPEQRRALVDNMKGQIERRTCPGFDLPVIGESKGSARSASTAARSVVWGEQELELLQAQAGVRPRRRSTGIASRLEALNLRDQRELDRLRRR